MELGGRMHRHLIGAMSHRTVHTIALLLVSFSTFAQPVKPQSNFGTTKIIFDQNDQSFYANSELQPVQYPAPDIDIPYGKFALYVGLGTNNGPFVPALQKKPDSFDNLKTGYYTIPQSTKKPLTVFGLVINADDPRNRQKDIAYSMPSVWLSSVTWPHEKILRPFSNGFDSLEYQVDLRVPFIQSSNPYFKHMVPDREDVPVRADFAAPYVLAGVYFEQLRRLGGTARPPAFWIAVSLVDLRLIIREKF
jgi:hypothetical protein